MVSSAPRVIGGRYELLEPIGWGGMGTVWRARDQLLGRTVAAKEILPPPGLSPTEQGLLRQRALREGRAAARIASKSAVTVYDVVDHDDRPWILMELLDARSLAQLLHDEGPRPPEQVIRIGLAVLDALEAAHRVGVVHRDVKPANVLLSTDGRVVLTDFGIATLEGDPTLTVAGTGLGSPAYMAPERAQGDDVTPSSDLWSLGVTLFAALDGASPFQRANALSTLNALLTEPVPGVPAPPGPLASVITGLMCKDVAGRLSAPQVRALLHEAARDPSCPEEHTSGAAPPLLFSGSAPLPRVLPASWTAFPRHPDAAPVAVAAVPAGPATRALPTAATPPPVSNSIPAVARRGGAVAVTQDRGTGLARHASRLVVTLLVLSAAVAAWTARDRIPFPGGNDRAMASSAAGDPATAGDGPTRTEPALVTGTSRYRDPSGFSVALPAGWYQERQGLKVDFREAGSFRYLRVEPLPDPARDPEADWRQQEPYVAKKLAGYQLLSIRPVPYRGGSAADWEFRWQAVESGQLRVRSRNLVTTSGRGYVLYFSAPDDQWEESRALMEHMVGTFEPAA